MALKKQKIVLISSYLVFVFLTAQNQMTFDGKSYFISTPWIVVGNDYGVFNSIQTNAGNGFRVVFRYLYLDYGVVVNIGPGRLGTGNDPSYIQSVHGFINHTPDDVYVYSNSIRYFAVTETNKTAHKLKIVIEIIPIDLSSEYWIVCCIVILYCVFKQ